MQVVVFSLRRGLGVFGLAVAACGAFGCSSKEGSAEQGVGATTLAPLQQVTIQLKTPSDVPSLAPILLASGSVSVASGAKIAQSPTAAAPSIALGSGGLTADADARLADVWSKGPVSLRDRVRVQGIVHAGSVTTGNGTVVTGGLDKTPVFDPLTTKSWTVEWPATAGSVVSVGPDQSRAILPGAFGSVTVAGRGQLNLSAGTYYFQSLDIEPTSSVRLNQDAGPVIIYVAGSVIYRGSFTTTNAAAPDLVLAALGNTTVYVEAPFTGTLLAPIGTIVLRKATHAGYFAAAGISVDAQAVVQYRAPNALVPLLAPPGTDVEQCANTIQGDLALTGNAREIAFQTAIARYCTKPSGPAGPTNAAILVGRGNADYALAALQLVHRTLDPAHYLAAVQDRSRKLRSARHDATFANRLAKGPDGDGDWIPDSSDVCPGTPPLTATDDRGCPTNVLPQAPSAADVQGVLEHMNLPFRDACNDTSMPPRTGAGAFYKPAQTGSGVYILATRAVGQPAGCPVWYEFEIEQTSAAGTVVYRTVFMDREETTDLIGLGLPVPARAIQFNPLPTDPGTRGQLGSAGGTGVRFRVRATNGGGQQSDFSEWRTTTNDDCLALGFKCG